MRLYKVLWFWMSFFHNFILMRFRIYCVGKCALQINYIIIIINYYYTRAFCQFIPYQGRCNGIPIVINTNTNNTKQIPITQPDNPGTWAGYISFLQDDSYRSGKQKSQCTFVFSTKNHSSSDSSVCAPIIFLTFSELHTCWSMISKDCRNSVGGHLKTFLYLDYIYKCVAWNYLD